ncbi:MAG: thioesterase family protein [Vicingaceae bacterium]
MLKEEITVRVRYSETDRMGYVYYGNYAAYFEVARVELLRKLGFSYRQMEDDGIMLPVADFHIRYLKPAFYDEELTIKVKVAEYPSSKIIFNYETINANHELLNTGETLLVFVDIQTARPCRPPSSFLKVIAPYFS